MILVNLRSVHMDKNRWGDPENFRPERFIDSDGQIVQNEWFIPFGQGVNFILTFFFSIFFFPF